MGARSNYRDSAVWQRPRSESEAKIKVVEPIMAPGKAKSKFLLLMNVGAAKILFFILHI